jgi:hypothetical protein
MSKKIQVHSRSLSYKGNMSCYLAHVFAQLVLVTVRTVAVRHLDTSAILPTKRTSWYGANIRDNAALLLSTQLR